MALVTFFFLIASFRTNITFVVVFLFIDLAFIMLMATYWSAAEGKTAVALKCQKVSSPISDLAVYVQPSAYPVLHPCLLSLIDMFVYEESSDMCDKAAGAFIFVFCVFGWYLFFTMMLLAVDFPLHLPTGDLSTIFKGASERKKPESKA